IDFMPSRPFILKAGPVPRQSRRLCGLVALLLVAAASPALGEEAASQVDADAAKYPDLRAFEATVPTWFPKLLGAQWTFVNQTQLPFDSPYSGLNSYNEHGENKTSKS